MGVMGRMGGWGSNFLRPTYKTGAGRSRKHKIKGIFLRHLAPFPLSFTFPNNPVIPSSFAVYLSRRITGIAKNIKLFNREAISPAIFAVFLLCPAVPTWASFA